MNLDSSRMPGARSSLVDIALFLGGATLVAAIVHLGVPALTVVGVDPLASWMLLSIPFLYTPIILCAWSVLKHEGSLSRTQRLRLQRPSAADWGWGLLGVLGIAAGSAALMPLCAMLGLDPNPPFARHFPPLDGGRWWILGLWVVYWPINILGEEFVWRGVVLPRMQERFADWAWLVNAVLWGLFHVAFGTGNLLVLAPTLIGVPLIAQYRRNTWLAVLMHAGLSGPGFIALFLGLV